MVFIVMCIHIDLSLKMLPFSKSFIIHAISSNIVNIAVKGFKMDEYYEKY